MSFILACTTSTSDPPGRTDVGHLEKYRLKKKRLKIIYILRDHGWRNSISFNLNYPTSLFLTVVPADYPSNQQIAAHFGEFLMNGYKPSLGCVEVKFDHGEGLRVLKPGAVDFVDGQTKVLIMLGILSFCSELEIGESDLKDPKLNMILKSFSSIRCSYQHSSNPRDHFLHSLRFL